MLVAWEAIVALAMLILLADLIVGGVGFSRDALRRLRESLGRDLLDRINRPRTAEPETPAKPAEDKPTL